MFTFVICKFCVIQYPTGIGILTGTGIVPGLDQDLLFISRMSPGFNMLHNFRGNYVIIDVAGCFMCPD